MEPDHCPFVSKVAILPPSPQTGGGQKASILGGELLGSTFLLQLTRKHSLVGSPPPNWGGNFTLSVAVSACFFRQSIWRCSNSPRKKSREFPPVGECFLVWVTDASVGRVCSCHHARPKSTRNSVRCKKKVRMELHILTFIEQCSGLQGRRRCLAAGVLDIWHGTDPPDPGSARGFPDMGSRPANIHIVFAIVLGNPSP